MPQPFPQIHTYMTSFSSSCKPTCMFCDATLLGCCICAADSCCIMHGTSTAAVALTVGSSRSMHSHSSCSTRWQYVSAPSEGHAAEISSRTASLVWVAVSGGCCCMRPASFCGGLGGRMDGVYMVRVGLVVYMVRGGLVYIVDARCTDTGVNNIPNHVYSNMSIHKPVHASPVGVFPPKTARAADHQISRANNTHHQGTVCCSTHHSPDTTAHSTCRAPMQSCVVHAVGACLRPTTTVPTHVRGV